MQLSVAAQQLNAPWLGDDVAFRGCGIDSRGLEQGELFVALKGEHTHGHAFLEQARRGGAAAALVEKDGVTELPTIVVPDSRLAMGILAANWRKRFDCPMVAVTGSNGKTTVKEMLAAILRRRGKVLATAGNLNNDLGVPLTLMGLEGEHRNAVVEMGANHAGEITGLAGLAQPTVGVITQCAPAHLEGFGSVEGVARAKGELITALDDDGAAVINRDDLFSDLWLELTGSRRVLTFGLRREADVTGEWRAEGDGARLWLHTPVGEAELRLPLPGRHNIMNALAAAAAAVATGVPLDDIAVGLENTRPANGRLRFCSGTRNTCVINDSYNANPASLNAGLAVLQGRGGRRWLVLADMAELGESGADYHEKAGRMAKESDVERLYATGDLARLAAESFGEGGYYFGARQELIDTLCRDLREGVTILVKGSRSMGMERVVAALTVEERSCC
ncbi:MAG: UDP-N-acetylmuramoyl-tripeptide--D-alanyl-D-alanine ligase [Gammaproteobacteria bacterium]|nr:UDP-N-acetylmuramoyl-tripeptide--D-alanyl-D-alanine ligase [Gammaproteobacteria bacterium]